jgi:hypothetical protein
MRTLALISGGVAAAAVLAVGFNSRSSDAQAPAAVADSLKAPVLAAGDTAGLPGPRQPIFFRHDIHAGQFKIECQYCHYTVAVSPEPGIPSTQTCMGCHTVIAGTDSSDRAEIRKLRQFWADSGTGKPRLEWVRVHTLARHAKFPHMLHIKAIGPNACQTCHGDVARMPQVWRVNNVNNMGFCISCHIERKVNRDCTACHY